MMHSQNEINEKSEGRPVVWAIDAFPDSEDLHLKTAAALTALYPDSPIQPTYILSEESFSERGFTTFLRPAIKPMALKSIRSLLRTFRNPLLKKPRVLLDQSVSQEAHARRLLHFSRKLNAQAIAAGTHGRSGLARLLSGSFTEALISNTEIPLLLTGPMGDEIIRRPRTVFFPTDLSPASLSHFRHALALASSYGASLFMFHKFAPQFDAHVQSGFYMFGGGWVTAQPFLEARAQDAEHVTEACRSIAVEQGVKFEFLREDSSEPVSEAILRRLSHLDRSSTIVAIGSQTGRLMSALLGSITRELVRLSPFPTYVVPRAAAL